MSEMTPQKNIEERVDIATGNLEKGAKSSYEFADTPNPTFTTPSGKVKPSVTGLIDKANKSIDDYRQTNCGLYSTAPTLGDQFDYTVHDGKRYYAKTTPYKCNPTTYPDPNNDTNLQLGNFAERNWSEEMANSGDSLLAGGKVLPVENRSVRKGEDLTGASFVKLKGGDFSELTTFVIKKINSNGNWVQEPLIGNASNINLTTKPYTVSVGSDTAILLDKKHWDEDRLNLSAFHIVFNDPAINNLAAFQSAVSFAGSKTLHGDKPFHWTDTINLEFGTKITGPLFSGGGTPGYSFSVVFTPVVIKSSTSVGIDNTATTIPLADASSFTSSGIVYINGINGEYVKYTGKSGSTLTGCTRGYFGGTIGNIAHIGGESVHQLKPAFFIDGAFSGSVNYMKIENTAYVDKGDVNTVWDDVGLGIYASKASYGSPINNAVFHGFEKVAYFGEAFVTALPYPMFYRCRYGIQMDTVNGATITGVDSGKIGSGAQEGWSLYTKGGFGCNVKGGNISNGGVSEAVIVDGTQCFTTETLYIEAAKRNGITAKNGANVKCIDTYYRIGQFFGLVEGRSSLIMEGITYEQVAYPYVRNIDNTGQWEARDTKEFTRDTFDHDQIGRGTERYSRPNNKGISSPQVFPDLNHRKILPNNTVIDLFKFRTNTDLTDFPDITSSIFSYYSFDGIYGSGGVVSEAGSLTICSHHRYNSVPQTTIAKHGDAQAKILAATMTLTFSSKAKLITGNRYEVIVSAKSVASNSEGGELKLFIKSSNKARVDSHDFGKITLL